MHCLPCFELIRPDLTHLLITKLYYSTVLKMSLIQPSKFRTQQMGRFKLPHFQTGGLSAVAPGLSGVIETGAKFISPHLIFSVSYLMINLFTLSNTIESRTRNPYYLSLDTYNVCKTNAMRPPHTISNLSRLQNVIRQ